MIALILIAMSLVGILIVALLFMYVLKHRPALDSNQKFLREHGIQAKGKVLSVEETGKYLDGTSYPIVKMTLEIYIPTEVPYTTTTEVPVSYRNFPSEGMPVKLLVNPKDHNQFVFGE